MKCMDCGKKWTKREKVSLSVLVTGLYRCPACSDALAAKINGVPKSIGRLRIRVEMDFDTPAKLRAQKRELIRVLSEAITEALPSSVDVRWDKKAWKPKP
jgi:DNA-directed RNA polymerase subunit RPC12/RpoP